MSFKELRIDVRVSWACVGGCMGNKFVRVHIVGLEGNQWKRMIRIGFTNIPPHLCLR